MSTDIRDDDIRAALHDLAASIDLVSTDDPVALVHERAAKSDTRVRGARVLAIAAVLAVVVGVVGVVATRDDDDGPDVATEPTPSTAAAPSIKAPTGLPVDSPVVLRFGSAWVRPGTDVLIELDNGSGDRVLYGPMLHVSRWNGIGWVPIADAVGTDATFQEWQGPYTGVVFDYDPTVVEPGDPSPHISLRLPDDLVPGYYRAVLYEGAREPVDGGDRERLEIEGRFEVIASDDFSHESLQFGPLPIDRVVLPDSVLTLDDGRVAIRFTTACNQPAEEIGFTTNGDRVLVEVRVGHFMVIDCVGEPSVWSVVLDPPVALAGKQVIAADDLGNRRAAKDAEITETKVLFERTDMGSQGQPAQVLGGPSSFAAPVAFSTAPPCSNIVRVVQLRTSRQLTQLETREGLFYEVRDAGSPGADCVPAPGWISLLPLISSPDEAPLAIPNVVGLDVDEAVELLEQLGFVVEVVVEGGGDVGGRVAAQDPAAAVSVSSGSTVRLTAAPG